MREIGTSRTLCYKSPSMNAVSRSFIMTTCFWAALPISASAQPSVPAGGVLNAASFAQAGLPNSGIAQGSIFVVFGSGLGPAVVVLNSGFPLPTELAGTSVRVTVSGTSGSALLLYTSATQVSAIMPSNTPVGEGTLTVTYNGQTSPPSAVTVVGSSFGIFTRSQAGSGPAWVQHAGAALASLFNSLVNPGRPGGVFTIYGTGLGAVADDRNPSPVQNLPAEVSVLVGNSPVTVLYSGRSPEFPGMDQINFQLSQDPPEGCYVPLAVKVGSVLSNFTSLSISRSASACSVVGGIAAADLAKAAAGESLNIGIVTLGRIRVRIVAGILGTIEGKIDAGTGTIQRFPPATLFAARGLLAGFGLSPYGTCTVFPFKTLGTIDEVVQPIGLDAGSAINVNGPLGRKTLAKASPGIYTTVIGGTLPLLPGLPGGGSNLPDYLEPGSYTIDNGGGGADVGAFSATVQIAPPLAWTNRDALTAAPRSQPLTANWSGGTANQIAVLTGLSQLPGGGGAGFNCVEQASKGNFTVPADVLSLLPVSATLFGAPLGTLSLTTTLLVQDSDKPKVSGLDVFFVNYADSNTRNLGYR